MTDVGKELYIDNTSLNSLSLDLSAAQIYSHVRAFVFGAAVTYKFYYKMNHSSSEYYILNQAEWLMLHGTNTIRKNSQFRKTWLSL